jgi:hypothetical protein
MAIQAVKGVIGAFVAGSLLFSSSAVMAAAAPAPQPDPWAVLTAMTSGAPAAAMCGSAVAATAAQAPGGCVLPVVDTAPAIPPPSPPPPVPVVAASTGFSPILIGLLALAAGIGVFFAVRDNGTANSPA